MTEILDLAAADTAVMKLASPDTLPAVPAFGHPSVVAPMLAICVTRYYLFRRIDWL